MRKIKNILLAFTAFAAATSCTEYEMITPTYEVPGSITEAKYLNKYGPLKMYLNETDNPNFKLGTGISLSDYMAKALYHRVVNSNFDEVTFTGSEMMQGSVVNNEGNLDLNNINAFLEVAKASNMSVFGNALVWHQNQNAAYLNRLIAPIFVENPLASNALNKAGLNNRSFNGWILENSGAGIAIENIDGQSTIVLKSTANSSSPNSLRITSPQIPVVAGREYEIVMYIRSDSEGEGRISFEGLGNNTPSLDWTGTGMRSESFETGPAWEKVNVKVNDIQGGSMQLHIDLGYKPNVTYYINVASLYVFDPESLMIDPNRVWLEAECATEMGIKWTTMDAPEASGEKYAVIPGTGGALTATGSITAADRLSFDVNIATQGTYALWALAAPSNPNTIANDDSFHFRSNNNAWFTWNNGMGSNSAWTWYQMNSHTLSPGKHTIQVAWREDGAKLDKLLLTRVTGDKPTDLGGSALNCLHGGFNLERSSLHKRVIIEEELESWISGIVTETKDQVKSWNVVNQPMDDLQPGSLRTGRGKTLASGEFYWQDYLGMDYGVTAFTLARKYASSDTKLFISGNGLESPDKSEGLVKYIEYIEGKGAKVDGIGAQIDVTMGVTQMESIKQSLLKLAATGKLVKISWLAVQVRRDGSSNNILASELSQEEKKAVSDLYRELVQVYFETIPKEQRAGISLNGPADTGRITSLWMTGFNLRNHAYGGFSNGLAGRDISQDQ